MSGVDIGAQMGADYRIELDNRDITSNYRPRLLSLKIEDKRALEADTCTLTLDDSDGQIIMPQRGNRLRISIGWQGAALFNKGEFIINDVTHTGSPDRLTLSGYSIDLSNVVKEQRSESYEGMTLGDIVQRIARRNRLDISLSEELAACVVAHIDQTSESDLQFLSRLAKRYGALATIKCGKVLLLRPGNGKTAKGEPLPEASILRQQGDSHTFSYTGTSCYLGTKARWLQLDKAGTGQVTVRAELDPPDKVFEPLGSRYLVLPALYHSQDEATHAAQAEWEKSQRMSATLSFQLARGRPELIPEMQVNVSGFKQLIDAHQWIITAVDHSVTGDKGFISEVKLERVMKGSVVVTVVAD